MQARKSGSVGENGRVLVGAAIRPTATVDLDAQSESGVQIQWRKAQMGQFLELTNPDIVPLALFSVQHSTTSTALTDLRRQDMRLRMRAADRVRLRRWT